MTIDTISIQCFLAAADTASFTKAAEKVGRTQSAVSQQVMKLESMLDKQLFKRGKSLTLTSEGEIFLGFAREIFKLHQETIDHFKQPEIRGEVSFGVPEDYASVFLYDVLSEFIQVHPKISLHIECDLSINLLNNFKQGKYDLAILKMKSPRDVDIAADLATEKLFWVGDSKLIKKDKILPLVLSPQPCVYRQQAIRGLEKKNIKWSSAFSSHSYAGRIAAVKAGLGITVLPRKLIPDNLKIIKSDFLPKLDNCDISMVKSRSDNPAVNSFEDFVVKHLR